MPLDNLITSHAKAKPYVMYGKDVDTESVVNAVTNAIHIALELEKPTSRIEKIDDHLRLLAQTFQNEGHVLLVHPDYIESTNLRLIVAELGITTQRSE